MAIIGHFLTLKLCEKDIFYEHKEADMKETKQHQVGVKLNDVQVQLLEKLIQEGKAKTKASAIQYLINQYSILNSK